MGHGKCQKSSQKQKTEDEDEVMEEFSIIQPTEVDNSNDSKSFDSDDDDQVLQAVKQNQSKKNNTTFIVLDDMAPKIILNNTSLEQTKETGCGKGLIQIAPGEGKIPTNLMRVATPI